MPAPRIAIAAALLLGTPAAVAAGLAISIAAYSVRHGPAAADAAVVLGAASWSDGPSPVFRERIHHALTLYHGGRVKKLILTGAADSANERPASEVAKRYAVARRVPAADILTEKQSRTTAENLCRARDLARANGLKTFLIVSDPLHMRRAMTMARDSGMDAYPAPTPTSRYRSNTSRIRFLVRELYYYTGYLAARLAGHTPCEE